MYLTDWIKEVGKKYLVIIQEEKPLFLGELQVTKEELSELFRRIRQCHSVDQCDETRASLAVAAVHAAVQASEEDNSYVAVFFRHLGEAENVAQWNYEYGPGILRFLVEHFEEVERPGAFRYVRPILNHAGISYRALPAFARFLAKLRDEAGPGYTRIDYARILKGVSSKFARNFLQEGPGYDFTREAMQTWERIERGIIGSHECSQLPGYRKKFWPDLLESLNKQASPPKREGWFPSPSEHLDFENRRLVLKFSEAGVLNDFFLDPSLQTSKAAEFPGWIANNAETLGAVVSKIIPSNCGLKAETALLASSAQMFGIDSVTRRLENRLLVYEGQRKQLTDAIVQAAKTGRSGEVSGANRALRSVEALIKQLKEEALIDFLSSEHWLPSYAFPQDVVRLLVRQEKYTDRMRLERDGEIGLSEYAPGAEIIADGKLFRSRGIDLQRKVLEKRRYRVCGDCRRVEFFTESEKVQRECTCGAYPSGVLGTPRTFIEPPGFTTLFDDPVEEPNLFRLKPPPNSEVFLLRGASEEMFKPHPEFPTITFGYSPKGTLFRANPGKKYGQFRICLKCGRSFEAKEKTSPHSAPWGSSCNNSHVVTTDLAFQFGTDTLQVRFAGDPVAPPINDESFWLSLQTTLVAAAAEVLAIPPSDIAGTYRSQFQAGAGGELVMYDRVPGGAGYVERIVRQLGTILQAALDRTRHCRNPLCDPEGSCYACLRSYGNQFKWNLLKRGPVARWLEQLMERRVGAAVS